MSDIENIIKQYQDLIRAGDRATLERLAFQWQKVEWGLESDIQALTEEIARRTLAGEAITQQMLWDMESYRRSQVSMEKLIGEYNQSALNIMDRAASDAFILGVNKADDLITAEMMLAGVMPPYWERLNVEAFNAMRAAQEFGSPLRALIDKDFAEVADAFNFALLDGIGRGMGVTQLAAALRDAVSVGLDRSMLIAQTEMGRAYRSGTINSYRESGVVEYYVRLVKKETACLACLALDGQKYLLEDDMQDHPRGYCDTIAKVKGVDLPDWEKGNEWLARQSEERQREIMGDARYEIWKADGKKDLDAFATFKDSAEWGLQPAIVPLRETQGYAEYLTRMARSEQ